MSRLELDKIQSQLKVAIQNHQILVSKIKLNTQDMGLKKQLHNLQREIMLMSEKQKIVVQKLRREIMERKTSLTANTSTPPQNYQLSYGPAMFSPHSMLTPYQPTDLSLTAPTPTCHPTDLSQRSTLTCQPTDLSWKSTPNCHSTDVPSTKPTPESRSTDLATQSPVLPRTELSSVCTTPVSKANPAVNPKNCSPLRIPQYPGNRPALLTIQGTNDIHHELTPRNGQIKPVIPKYSPTKENCNGTESNDVKKSIDEKGDARELRKKLEFMASVELVSRDSIKEMQGRRTERKRRSTCNPNFAYGFELERRPRMSSFLASALLCAKRSKAKAKPDVSPTTSRPGTPDSGDMKLPSLTNTSSQVIVHETLCTVCGTSGQLLLCDTCTSVYHLHCITPPLSDVPSGVWSCHNCQEASQRTAMSLAAVNSYIANKTGKEEEKRKLLKRSTELLHDKTQLENRSKQLNDILAHQGIRKQELLDINRKAHQSVENLKQFVKAVQSS